MTDETPDVPAESPSDETVTEDAPESPSADENADAETEESTSEAEADAEPKEWKNLLDKYKGDKAAAANAYWSATKDNARLAKEAKAAREELETLRKAKAEPEKPAEPHPSLKEIDKALSALEKEHDVDLPQREADLFGKYEAQKKSIAVLEYELKHADDIDKRSLESRLDAAEMRRENLEDKIRAIRERYDTLERQHRYYQDQKGLTQKHLDSEAKAKQEQEEYLKVFNEEFPAEIDGYVTRFCDEFKIPQSEREDVWEAVYDKCIGHAAKYRGTEEDADKDWMALVRSKVEKEAKRIERAGRSHFAQVSKETKKVLSNPGTTRPAPRAESTAPKFDDGLTPAMRKARNNLASKGL